MVLARGSTRSLFFVLALGVASSAAAAPQYPRLSYTGDPSTTITVAWNTDADGASEVRYGLVSGTYTQTATGTSLQANAGLGYVHEVTLTGLTPATVYYYVAGNATDGYTGEHSFRTGPVEDAECGHFTFAFLGDNRPDPTFGGGENWAQILNQAAAQGPAFALNGGDLVPEGTDVSAWKDFLGWTSPDAAAIAFMPCLGNHDTGPTDGDGANYNQLFALPRSTGTGSSGTEDYYYFTFGNAIFVALSTESYKGGTIPFADQAAWLDEVLTQNPRKWKFVFYHKPSYTHEVFFSISHASNEEGQNAALIPIIDKHHVDVVFTSHNHWYERYQPSACATAGKPGSGDPCPVGETNYAAGTVYYVSGGAGAFTIPGILCGAQAGRVTCNGSHNYLLATIDNETLTLATWAAYPQTNQVIDSITITKPASTCTPVATDGGTPQSDAAVLPDGAAPRDGAAPADGAVPPVDGAAADGAGPGADGGAEAAPASGCNCRAGAGGATPPLLLLLAVGVLVAWRRRRG